MGKNQDKFIAAIKVCHEERIKALKHGDGGTGWPGKCAQELYPEAFEHALSDLKESFCVLGTNGKTTTCRIISKMLTLAGLPHGHNREGANMPTGLVTTLLLNCDEQGQPKTPRVLLECDELSFEKISTIWNPSIIVITNVYPDQEWRLQNVEQVTQYLVNGILRAPQALVCLNQDSVPCMNIAKKIPNRKIFYSVRDNTIFVEDQPIHIHLRYYSPAYLYDAAAACAFAKARGISENIATTAAETFTPAFGRMESLSFGKKTVFIEMVKNKACLDNFMTYALKHGKKHILIIALWDQNIWLKDTDFTPLFTLYSQIYVAGPDKNIDYLLRYPSVNRLSEDELLEKIMFSAQNITLLADYYGNLTIHKMLAQKGYIPPDWMSK